ncbi:hypothetical protein KC573_02675 [candidate division WWE3 bacterium]|uniref:Cohesin domain-containing protein n=1 Tax=candidate division WWE3 bacterium TaxID=2053526 RepID=A0A955LW58_UNCKA|nr:hypothetical protein [candidate division WWE3 bacterium]
MIKKLSSIFIFGAFLFFLNPSSVHAQAASLFQEPATQTLNVGDTFSVEIRVNTGGQDINTVAANLTYDNAALTPQSVDTSGSFVSIWFENNIASSAGEVRLTGSVPSPGVNENNLLFARVNFIADQATTTQISFKDDSAVFRDSDNVDVLGESTGSVITVATSGVTPTSGSGTPTPTITGGTTPSVTVGPGTPTPTILPDAGITTPTLSLLFIAILLSLVAIGLLL